MDGSELIVSKAKVVWVVRRKAIEPQKPSFYDTGIEFVDIKEEHRARIGTSVEHLVKHGHEASYR
jgi:hypothetical protein